MDGGLLSLKWNHHKSSFLQVLSTVRRKSKYTDATIACDGTLYKVHKLVLSTCSEYFEKIFDECEHPVIVLKDIRSDDFESLLSYMYIGEVNVDQDKLASLIKAAECLKIKGLAVCDDEPKSSRGSREKRSAQDLEGPECKRRRESGPSGTDETQVKASQSHCESFSGDISNSKAASSESSFSDGLRNAGKEFQDKNLLSVAVKQEEVLHDSLVVSSKEAQESVKEEPVDDDIDEVFIDDSNPASEVNDYYGSDSQHFMDEIFNQNSDQANTLQQSDYTTAAEGISTAQNSVWPSTVNIAMGKFGNSDSLSLTKSLSNAGLHLNSHALISSNGVGNNYHPYNMVDKPASVIQPIGAITNSDDSNTVNTQMYNQFSLGNGQFCCPICRKIIKGFAANFRDHCRTHTGEKPHQCPYCGYRSSRKRNVTRHLLLKHQQMI